MPSIALTRWRTIRLPRLAELEAQVRAVRAAKPVKKAAAEEIARAYVLMLSGHFQGFCRELYSEAADALVSQLEKARKGLAAVFKLQVAAQLKLDHGNPTWENIRFDFERFGLDLRVEFNSVPRAGALLQSLSQMNRTRNAVAHDDRDVADVVPITDAIAWRDTCSALVEVLEGAVFRKLKQVLRAAPWTP